MVLLISYDLNGRERPSSYTRMKNYIEEHAVSSVRPLYSQWLIDTGWTPEQWVKAFHDNSLIDSNDRVFVCQIRSKGDYQGYLDNSVWKWLTPRVS